MLARPISLRSLKGKDMVNGPIRYSADVEQEQDDEQATVAKLNDAFDIILERTAEDYGHAVRSVHAKSHGLLEGELTVDANLPAELAQGLFATPGVHKVLIRLSTNAGDILPDVISLPRGLAMKVFDVEGERLPGAEGSAQDFVMVNGPVFQAKTAEKFLGNLKLLARTTDRMEGTKTVASAVLRGVRHALEAVGGELPSGLNSLGGAPNSEPLGDTYYSATAFRYGDYIAKFSLAPVAPEMTALTGKEIDVDGRENAIREEVRAEVRGMDLEWEFRVQLCRDLDAQPVEDATVRWDEQDAPFLRVGMVRAAAQDSWSDDHVRRINEESRFSVWTGIAAHRPLGNINRVRKDTYRHSADFRARTNGCPYHEPVARDAGAGQG
ncbi:hypothetical protein C8J46_101585 [Sphingomonas sp. PP-F2F-A104-K0414]|nr:hypothetical protein C8J46_101585 [Sphingomonas sp. PP-F2F-A104-K0414]